MTKLKTHLRAERPGSAMPACSWRNLDPERLKWRHDELSDPGSVTCKHCQRILRWHAKRWVRWAEKTGVKA